MIDLPGSPLRRAPRGIVHLSADPDGTVQAVSGADGEVPALVGRPLPDLFEGPERAQVQSLLEELRSDPGPFHALLGWPGQGPEGPLLRWTIRRLPPAGEGPILATAMPPVPRATRPRPSWPGNEYFRAIFDEAQDGIVVCDTQRRIVDANPAFCEFLDRPRGSLLGESLDALVAPERRGEVTEDWQALLRAGSQSGRLDFLKSGARRVIDYRATARILPDRHLLILRDVTARQRAETRARMQARRFEALYRLRDAAGRSGDDARLHRIALQGLVRTLDLEGAALVLGGGRGLAVVATEGSGVAGVETALAGRPFPKDPAELARMSGMSQADVVELGDGRPAGALLLRRSSPLDRDERAFARLQAGILAFALRRLSQDQALARERANLARSNEELAQFAYIASHDLQEPLRTVASFVELLRRRYQGRLDPDADEMIGYVRDGARRMSEMIQDLLAYSRLDRAGDRTVPVNLGQLVDELRESLRSRLEETGGTIERTGLPVLVGHAGQFSQLFLNLLGNALKFRGPDPPRVRVEAEARGPAWRFAVSDNGIGIAPQHRERVFGMFQRLHHREEFEGTGMGLAICRKIVEGHGGRIWADAAPRGGTVIRFTLPG